MFVLSNVFGDLWALSPFLFFAAVLYICGENRKEPGMQALCRIGAVALGVLGLYLLFSSAATPVTDY